jgi:hypothetical protein
VGTTNPQVSLQVDRSTVATDADGVLVPRVTVAQLNDKAAAYVAAQNGALVFITDITGFAGKTSNVTATGFHYYNSTTEKWVAVGGAPQRYEGTRGTVTQVNATTYTVQPNDYLIETRHNAQVTITFPALTNTAADIGRTVQVFNNNTDVSGTLYVGVTGGNTATNQRRGRIFTWTGSQWVVIGL